MGTAHAIWKGLQILDRSKISMTNWVPSRLHITYFTLRSPSMIRHWVILAEPSMNTIYWAIKKVTTYFFKVKSEAECATMLRNSKRKGSSNLDYEHGLRNKRPKKKKKEKAKQNPPPNVPWWWRFWWVRRKKKKLFINHCDDESHTPYSSPRKDSKANPK